MLAAIGLVISMAHDHSLETRIRCLIASHRAADEVPKTLVMNRSTWHDLVDELDGVTYDTGYFWTPSFKNVNENESMDTISFYQGIPILIKDFVADSDVIVGI
jgi:hypothetical protein